MLGLSDNLTKTVFVYLCICVFAFVYLGVRHLGTLFLFVPFLFKNISHHGCFQGFTARELCGANKWMGCVGWDGNLCVGLLFEHHFAVLIKEPQIYILI